MPSPPNYLRVNRKRSPLTHADIGYLMKLSDHFNISRCEQGYRTPSIELIILYHFLFDTSIDSFFELHAERILSSLLESIETLITQLESDTTDPKNVSRIQFLKQVLIR